jgi:anti-sigma B factor antagonist
MAPQQPRLEVTTPGDKTVARFTGSRLCLDETTAVPLLAQLNALADGAGQGPLLLDLGNVEFLSSTTLGGLVQLHRRLKAAGRPLTICNVSPVLYEVFDTTRLVMLMDVRRDMPDTGTGKDSGP